MALFALDTSTKIPPATQGGYTGIYRRLSILQKLVHKYRQDGVINTLRSIAVLVVKQLCNAVARITDLQLVQKYIRSRAIRLTGTYSGPDEKEIVRIRSGLDPKEISPIEEIIPLAFSQESEHYLHAADYQFQSQYVFEARNAQLIGPHALATTGSGRIILDALDFSGSRLIPAIKKSIQHNPIETMIGISSLVVTRKYKEEKRFKTVCSLYSGWNNYYHWMTEHLLKIQGVELYEQETGVRPLLIIPDDPPSYVTQSLKMLGYGEDDCIEWKYTKATIDRLVVPSYPEIMSDSVSWIRQRMIGNLMDKSREAERKRIYISRGDSKKRRVVNEGDLIRALSSYGFEKYSLSGMSIRDQVRLFSKAESVVAPHGAGLTNLLWGKEIKVIELFGSYIKPHYARLSDAAGHFYSCVRCSQVTEDHNSDIIVNLDKVVSELENAIKQV